MNAATRRRDELQRHEMHYEALPSPIACPVKNCVAMSVSIYPWHYCPDHGIFYPKDWNHHFRGWYGRG